MRWAAVVILAMLPIVWLLDRQDATDPNVPDEPSKAGRSARRVIRTPLNDADAAGRNWALRTDSGFVVRNGYRDAATACLSLGSEWSLPSAAPDFPSLDPWPTWTIALEVWLADGRTAVVEAGTAFPRIRAAAADERTEHGVLCVR